MNQSNLDTMVELRRIKRLLGGVNPEAVQALVAAMEAILDSRGVLSERHDRAVEMAKTALKLAKGASHD